MGNLYRPTIHDNGSAWIVVYFGGILFVLGTLDAAIEFIDWLFR